MNDFEAEYGMTLTLRKLGLAKEPEDDSGYDDYCPCCDGWWWYEDEDTSNE